MAEFTGLNMQFDVDAKREATEEERRRLRQNKKMKTGPTMRWRRTGTTG
jgi:hypothetical protein